MQYRLKKENLEQQNTIVDFQQLKQELKQKMKEETHRRNVDDAKKRAVNQHVEYDQFEQLVLGANLKALKADEILKLQELHKKNYQLQNLQNEFDIKNKEEKNLTKEQKNITKYEPIESFEDLKKFHKIYNSTCNKNIHIQHIKQILNYWQNIDNLEKVFGFDFESEIFIDFIKKIFQDFDSEEEIINEIFDLLLLTGDVSNFDMLIKISLTQYQKRYLKRISKEWLKKTEDEKLMQKILKFQNIYEIN